jgi:tRNA (adenine22-N1)-methyltransferase
MILLLFLIFGLIIGILRGGGLSGLARMKLHWLWLILIAAAAELAIFLLPHFLSAELFQGMLMWLQIARFAPLLLFALINITNWRVLVAALGIAANFAVIYLNHWQMPIDPSAAVVPGLAAAVQRVTAGSVPEYFIMQSREATSLWYFADIVPLVPGGLGFASVGDILLGLGVLLTVQHGMAKYSFGKHVRGSHAKLAADKKATVSRRRSSVKAIPAEPSVAFDPVMDIAPAVEPVQAAMPAPAREPEHIPEPEPEPVVAPTPAEVPVPGEARGRRMKPQKPDKKKKAGKSASQPGDDTGAMLLETLPDSMYAPEPVDSVAYGGGQQIKLSPRLEIVAFMVGRAATVADVGCDHGKLSAWLALNRSSSVIALDISAKSLAKTKQLVKTLNLHGLVQTRVSDGLRKLKQGEADVIVISGLGGPTICSILEEGHAVASSAAKLVLQPMNAIGMVRRWLADNGYCITGEQLAEEDNRIYQILSAVPGADGCPPMSLFDLEVGHLLIDNKHPLLRKLLEYKTATIEKILSEIAGIATPKAEARRSELISLRDRCSEVLEWLAR